MISDKLEHAMMWLLYCSGGYFILKGTDVLLHRVLLGIETIRKGFRDGR